MPLRPCSDSAAFRALLRQSKTIVAIAGAGLSAASGGYSIIVQIIVPVNASYIIQGYQLSEAQAGYGAHTMLWNSLRQKPSIRTQAGSGNSTTCVERRKYHTAPPLTPDLLLAYRAAKAQPNAAHLALATLAVPDMLKQLAPHARFTLVTQNVDGLSRRALERTPGADPSASPIYEMHGRIFETICTACGDRRMNTDSPICEALRALRRLCRGTSPSRISRSTSYRGACSVGAC